MTNTLSRRQARQIDDESAAVIFDNANNRIAVAQRSNGAINVAPYPADEVGPFIQHSQIRTVTFNWSAFTTPLDLATACADDSDEQITRALLAAIRTEPDRLLPANTELAYTALDWSRSSRSELTITKADLNSVETAVNYNLQWLRMGAERAIGAMDDAALPWTVSVETPSRALARFWLTEVADRSGDRFAAARDAVVAFVTVDNEGYAIALWSASSGLVHETEERLRSGIDVTHISDRVASLVNPASLSEFNIQTGQLSTIVLCTAQPLPELRARLEGRLSKVDVMALDDLTLGDGQPALTYATVLAIGAIIDDARIPSIDLADNLQSRLDRVDGERALIRQAANASNTRQALLVLLAPMVIMLGTVIAWYFSSGRAAATIQADTQAATLEAARLANEARLRKSYEDQTKYYMALTEQILQLRERQPFMLRLLTDLNDRWPRDPTLSLVSLRTNAGGGVELKGKTRQQDTVTQLASSLEFGGGRFTDISPESKAEIPGLSAGTPASAAAVGAGATPVISFSIKATYTPLAAALSTPKPPPPPAKQGGNAK